VYSYISLADVNMAEVIRYMINWQYFIQRCCCKMGGTGKKKVFKAMFPMQDFPAIVFYPRISEFRVVKFYHELRLRFDIECVRTIYSVCINLVSVFETATIFQMEA